MAKQPWVTPAQIKEYTDNPKVVERSDVKLAVDISRAEMYVIKYTNNHFDDEEKYPELPDGVVTAVILLAEMYANAAVESKKGNYKGETFDDYSYTLADTAQKQIDLDLGPLLDEFVYEAPRRGVKMKISKL